jgi:hypothetical protein
MTKAKRGDIQKSYILIAEKDGVELARAKSPSRNQADFINFLVSHRLDIFDKKIKCRSETDRPGGEKRRLGHVDSAK